MIAALFVRGNSHYKNFQDVDCFDFERDALSWSGGCPGIFHPPCRAWSNLSHFAKPVPGEAELAIWSIEKVRLFGGVVEHPINSRLWSTVGCGSYGTRDSFGGILVPVFQSWFGHKAFKKTGLYIVGPLPELPDSLAPVAVQPVQNMSRACREMTPLAFASFLVSVAHSCATS